jgi:hypothetical protein
VSRFHPAETDGREGLGCTSPCPVVALVDEFEFVVRHIVDVVLEYRVVNIEGVLQQRGDARKPKGYEPLRHSRLVLSLRAGGGSILHTGWLLSSWRVT